MFVEHKTRPARSPGAGATSKEAARRTARLFARLRRGDCVAREELITNFSPLSRRLARRYRNTSEPWEDLCQVAQLGLVKAVDGFDPDRGFPFASYAIPTILGELRRHFRSASWAVRVPRSVQERALEVRDAERALTDEQGHSPTVPELAQFMELSVEETLDALQALRALGSVSLDAPRGGEGADETASSYAETIGAVDKRYELVELDTDLCAALGKLEDRQREILRLRFFEDMSQREIAQHIGVSQMQVSRLLGQCVSELQELTQPPA